MTAATLAPQFVVIRRQGRFGYQKHLFPNIKPHERPSYDVIARYELTDEQAALSIDDLIRLCAADKLKKWTPPLPAAPKTPQGAPTPPSGGRDG